MKKELEAEIDGLFARLDIIINATTSEEARSSMIGELLNQLAGPLSQLLDELER